MSPGEIPLWVTLSQVLSWKVTFLHVKQNMANGRIHDYSMFVYVSCQLDVKPTEERSLEEGAKNCPVLSLRLYDLSYTLYKSHV